MSVGNTITDWIEIGNDAADNIYDMDVSIEQLIAAAVKAVAPHIRRAALEEAAGVACPFSDTRARTGWEAAMRTIRALDA